MEYPITLTKDKYLKAAVSLINCISSLNLTDFELDIVTMMLKHKAYKLNNNTRTILRETLGKDRFNLNNYLKRLKDKKVLLKGDKEFMLNPGIIEAINGEELIIKLNVHKDN